MKENKFELNSNKRGMNPDNEKKEARENEEYIEKMLTQLTDKLKTFFNFTSNQKPEFLVHVFGGNDSPISVVMIFPDTYEKLEITGEYSYNPRSLKNLVFHRENYGQQDYKLVKYESQN